MTDHLTDDVFNNLGRLVRSSPLSQRKPYRIARVVVDEADRDRKRHAIHGANVYEKSYRRIVRGIDALDMRRLRNPVPKA